MLSLVLEILLLLLLLSASTILLLPEGTDTQKEAAVTAWDLSGRINKTTRSKVTGNWAQKPTPGLTGTAFS